MDFADQASVLSTYYPVVEATYQEHFSSASNYLMALA